MKVKSITCDVCNNYFEVPLQGWPNQRKSCKSCYRVSRMVDQMLAGAKYRSQDKNSCDLDRSFLIGKLKEGCPVLKTPFELDEKGNGYKQRHPLSPSMDRINPDAGYTKENTRLVCWWYNLSKARYTDEEVLGFCKLVVSSSSTGLATNVVVPTE